jgi:type II secretory pathway component PulF
MRNFFNIFNISDQIFFTHRLSILLNSNLSVLDSLKIIKSMEINKYKIKIYESLISDCQKGISLSKSLLNLNIKLDYFMITLIKNGEQTGSLILALSQISKNLEKKNELKKRLISTLIYPIFIFVATIFMAIFLVMYIFPKILPLLNSLNIELPFLTRLIKFLYESGASYGLYIIISIIVVLIITKLLYKKYSYLRLKFHQFILTIPLLSNYIILNINSSICSIGEILLSSNRSLSDLHIFNRDTINNLIYKNIFDLVYTESIVGISFTQSLSRFPKFFNRTMINMCEIGERSGNLSEMMGHCSRIFEQDIDLFLKRFSSLIEPVLMIFMGLIVGSIALSIILPIYEITNHLNK